MLDAPNNNRIHFVVNVDRKESDLSQLPEGEIQGVAKAMGASIVKSFNDTARSTSSAGSARRSGSSSWRSWWG